MARSNLCDSDSQYKRRTTNRTLALDGNAAIGEGLYLCQRPLLPFADGVGYTCVGIFNHLIFAQTFSDWIPRPYMRSGANSELDKIIRSD